MSGQGRGYFSGRGAERGGAVGRGGATSRERTPGRGRGKTAREATPKTTVPKTVTPKAPAPKPKKSEKQIPITDNIDDVMDVIDKYRISFISGFTSTDLVNKVMSKLRAGDLDNRFLFCFKYKGETENYAKASPFKNKHLIYDGSLDPSKINYDEYRAIFSTTSQAKKILKYHQNSDKITHVFIHGWDKYDAGAYLLYAIIKHFNVNTSIIFSSVSRWANLPIKMDPDASINYTNNNIKFLFEPKEGYKSLISRLEGQTYLYGASESMNDENVIEPPNPFRMEPSAQYVVDTLKHKWGAYISKHIADLRADSIDKGTVYVLASKETYDGLKSRGKESSYSGLSKVYVWMTLNGIPFNLFPEDQRELLQSYSKDIPKQDLIYAAASTKLGLDVKSAILSRKWLAFAQKYALEDIGKMKSSYKPRRRLYLAILVSALIDMPPRSYGELEDIRKFGGRNDIEVMSLMWLDLINTHNYPFHLWDEKTQELVIKVWCKKNKIDIVTMSKLFKIVSDFYNSAIVKLAELANKKDFVFKDNFSAITTDELNIAREMIKHSELFPLSNNQALVSRCLNPTPPSSFYILNGKGNKVTMYIEAERLESKPCKVENLDNFLVL